MSERKLSKSYSSIQKWEHSNGHTEQWIRWDFSTPKEEWLTKNMLTEKWLYESLEWMIGEEISFIQKARESRLYYIVTTKKGDEYCCVFEKTKKGSTNELILIFEDHWQNYHYNNVLHTLEFDFEMYDCFQNGIDHISFSHQENKNLTYIETIIVGGKIDLKFSSKNNYPVWKMLNEYNSLFEEISKYNSERINIFDRKSQIEVVAKVAKMFKQCIGKDITRFKVVFDYNEEWFDYDSKGISIKMRIFEDGNCVICHKDGSTEWLERFFSYDKGYRIKDGVIVNWNNEKVTDQKLAKTIISDIRKAKSLFHNIKQEFWAN